MNNSLTPPPLLHRKKPKQYKTKEADNPEPGYSHTLKCALVCWNGPSIPSTQCSPSKSKDGLKELVQLYFIKKRRKKKVQRR